MPSVVLVLPKSGYRNDDFLAAAKHLGVDVIAASDVCHQLADIWEETPVALRFRDAESAAGELAREVAGRRPVAVIGVDDLTALVAAMAAERLGLPHNPPQAVAAARSKAQSREQLRAAGLPVPRFAVVPLSEVPDWHDFPCVVKPLVLSGSRGVIRADDPAELRAAMARIGALLRSPDVAQRREMALCLHARSENPEHRRVRARQPPGRHRRRRCGPHLGDEPPVHDRERLAGLGLEHHDERVVGVDPDVLRIERDELGAEGTSVSGHEGEEAVMRRNGKYRPHRLHDVPRRQRRERLCDGGNEVLIVEPLRNGRLVEDDDVHHKELCADGCLLR